MQAELPIRAALTPSLTKDREFGLLFYRPAYRDGACFGRTSLSRAVRFQRIPLAGERAKLCPKERERKR